MLEEIRISEEEKRKFDKIGSSNGTQTLMQDKIDYLLKKINEGTYHFFVKGNNDIFKYMKCVLRQ